MAKLSQTERVLRHLQDHDSITSLEAMQEYGIYRLASRISDLKKAGIGIQREFVSGTNRYGEKTKFVRYSLKKEAGECRTGL